MALVGVEEIAFRFRPSKVCVHFHFSVKYVSVPVSVEEIFQYNVLPLHTFCGEQWKTVFQGVLVKVPKYADRVNARSVLFQRTFK